MVTSGPTQPTDIPQYYGNIYNAWSKAKFYMHISQKVNKKSDVIFLNLARASGAKSELFLSSVQSKLKIPHIQYHHDDQSAPTYTNLNILNTAQ